MTVIGLIGCKECWEYSQYWSGFKKNNNNKKKKKIGEHSKKKITRHNTDNLRGSAIYRHPPETIGRKFHYNKDITMFGLKALSLSPNSRYIQVHSLTQRIKSEDILYLFFLLCDTPSRNSHLHPLGREILSSSLSHSSPRSNYIFSLLAACVGVAKVLIPLVVTTI